MSQQILRPTTTERLRTVDVQNLMREHGAEKGLQYSVERLADYQNAVVVQQLKEIGEIMAMLVSQMAMLTDALPTSEQLQKLANKTGEEQDVG